MLLVPLVAVVAPDRVRAAPDVVDWVVHPALGDVFWRDVAFGEDGNGDPLWVAVGRPPTSGSGPVVKTSPDGVNWTARFDSNFTDLYSVQFGTNGAGGRLWVAVGNQTIVTSADGITWTEILSLPSGTNSTWRSVTYADGLWVAVANAGANRAMWSEDGAEWTPVDVGENSSWSSVATGLDVGNTRRWIAVAESTTTDEYAMTSNDGKVWVKSVLSSKDRGWTSIAYGDQRWVAVANTGVGDRIMTTIDGGSWELRSEPPEVIGGTPETNSWNAIAFGGGRFVAVSPSAPRILTSTDGTTWEYREEPGQGGWRAIGFGDGLWVALAFYEPEESNLLMTSGLIPGPVPEFGTPTPTADGFVVSITNYDPDFAWLVVDPPAGISGVVGSDGVLTVTGLADGADATVTVDSSRPGYQPRSADITGEALLAALVPTFSTPTATTDGFTVIVTNYDEDDDFTWTVTGAATTIATDGTIEVTGLDADASATVTVTTTQAGYVDGSASVTGTALPAPVVTSTDGGGSSSTDGDDGPADESDAEVDASGDGLVPTGVSAGGGPPDLRTRIELSPAADHLWVLGAVLGLALMLGGRMTPAARSPRRAR